ncbi:MAG: hypothetical protein NC393_00575 [Clostridium sp.]|nr:hypothetical protein [Clostridium sp.]MCM1207308.1 hypothetical protein [Ruminococcus sp.]
MSGPKYSAAELAEQKKIELEKERIKKVDELKNKRKIVRDELFKIVTEIQELDIEISSSVRDNVSFYSDEIKKLMLYVEQLKIDLSGDADELKRKIEELTTMLKKMKSVACELKRKFGETVVAEKIAHSTVEKKGIILNASFEDYEKEKQKKQLYSFMNEVCLLKRDKEKIQHNCEMLLNSIERGELKKNIDDSVKDLSTFVFISKKKYHEFMDFYDEYVCYCETFGHKPDTMDAFHSVDEIEDEIAKLRKKAAEIEKLKYISDTISEVMLEYGHEVIQSDIIFPVDDKRTIKSVFEFGDSDAISVKISDRGAIVMEVVATGEDSEICEHEKEHAVEKMIEFCEQYPEIVDALEEKGVFFANRNDMPPSREFAKKIRIDRKQSENIQNTKKADRRRRVNGKNYKSSNL